MGSYGIYNPGTQALAPVDKPQAADGKNPATLIPLRMALHTFGPEAFELPPHDAVSEVAPPAKIGPSVNLLEHSYIAPLTGAHVILVLQGDPAPDPYTTVVWLACGSDGRFKIWKTLGDLTTERLQESLPSDGYAVTLGQVFRVFWSLAPEPVDRMWGELEAAYKSLGPLPDKADLSRKLAPVTKSPLWSTIKIGLYYDALDRFGYELWRFQQDLPSLGAVPFLPDEEWKPNAQAGFGSVSTSDARAQLAVDLMCQQMGLGGLNALSLVRGKTLMLAGQCQSIDERAFYIIAPRPRHAMVYLAELIEREFRRHRANYAWTYVQIARMRGLALAAASQDVVPSIHAELEAKLTALGARNPSRLARRQAQWAYRMASRIHANSETRNKLTWWQGSELATLQGYLEQLGGFVEDFSTLTSLFGSSAKDYVFDRGYRFKLWVTGGADPGTDYAPEDVKKVADQTWTQAGGPLSHAEYQYQLELEESPFFQAAGGLRIRGDESELTSAQYNSALAVEVGKLSARYAAHYMIGLAYRGLMPVDRAGTNGATVEAVILGLEQRTRQTMRAAQEYVRFMLQMKCTLDVFSLEAVTCRLDRSLHVSHLYRGPVDPGSAAYDSLPPDGYTGTLAEPKYPAPKSDWHEMQQRYFAVLASYGANFWGSAIVPDSALVPASPKPGTSWDRAKIACKGYAPYAKALSSTIATFYSVSAGAMVTEWMSNPAVGLPPKERAMAIASAVSTALGLLKGDPPATVALNVSAGLASAGLKTESGRGFALALRRIVGGAAANERDSLTLWVSISRAEKTWRTQDDMDAYLGSLSAVMAESTPVNVCRAAGALLTAVQYVAAVETFVAKLEDPEAFAGQKVKAGLDVAQGAISLLGTAQSIAKSLYILQERRRGLGMSSSMFKRLATWSDGLSKLERAGAVLGLAGTAVSLGTSIVDPNSDLNTAYASGNEAAYALQAAECWTLVAQGLVTVGTMLEFSWAGPLAIGIGAGLIVLDVWEASLKNHYSDLLASVEKYLRCDVVSRSDGVYYSRTDFRFARIKESCRLLARA